MKLARFIIFLCIVSIAAGGCAALKGAAGEKEAEGKVVRNTITLKPSGSYEECIAMQPGTVLNYNFNASDFVDFNIHYHGKDNVHYPVDKKGRMWDKGTIDPERHPYYIPEQEYYCLMWDNPNIENVKISFTSRLSKK